MSKQKSNKPDISTENPVSNEAKDLPNNADEKPTETGKQQPNNAQESTPEKSRFHWFFWLIAVILVLGIVVGFYYPNFYRESGDYIKYMTDKIMGKEPQPLRINKNLPNKSHIAVDLQDGRLDILKQQTSAPFKATENSSPETAYNAEDAEDTELSAENGMILKHEAGAKTVKEKPNPYIAKLAEAEQKAATMATELSFLQAKFSTMQSQLLQQNEMATLFQNALKLRRAALSGKGFAPEIEAFTKAQNINETIEKNLAKIGVFKTGIKTESVLRSEFEPLFKKALVTPVTPTNPDFWDKTINSLKTVIIIRKKDGSEGGVKGMLTSAQLAVKSGNLSKAAQILYAMPPTHKDIFADWINDVIARQQVIIATDEILDEVINLLSIPDDCMGKAAVSGMEQSTAKNPGINNDTKGK